jgi:hypothetical protein
VDKIELVGLYPRLFHMAAKDSWPSIAAHGLLSTQKLVDLWEVAPPTVRRSLLGQRRPDSVTIENGELGRATIRDQKPLDEASLREALTDMTPHDWYTALNSRVFFFLQPERLSSLLNARSYKNDEQVVITIDTAQFVNNYSSEIELCKINSGFAQPHNHVQRGAATFQSIEDYPHRARAVARTKAPWDVAELCVQGGVDDIASYVTAVTRMKCDVVLEVLV